MKSNFWGNDQNSELNFEISDLPEWITTAIKKTIEQNPSQCLDHIKAKGHCLRVSDQLMYNLSEEGRDLVKPFINCKIIYRKRPQPHFWLFIDGWHIDLTAKQFDPNQNCPKIWKHGEINLGNIYSVEKGRDMVLFYLTPFTYGKVKKPNYVNRVSDLVFSIKRIIRLDKRILDITRKSLIPFR